MWLIQLYYYVLDFKRTYRSLLFAVRINLIYLHTTNILYYYLQRLINHFNVCLKLKGCVIFFKRCFYIIRVGSYVPFLFHLDILELSYRFHTLHGETVMYGLGSIATLYLLPERPYVHLKHADFFTFLTTFCIISYSSDFC